MLTENKEIILAEYPKGVPNEETFQIKTIETEKPKEGEVLLKTLYISVDPGMRNFMKKGDDDATGKKYALNQAINSRGVAQVIESNSSNFKKGDLVSGRLEWKKYQNFKVDELNKVDPNLKPISAAVTLLGVPGLAAYFGLLKIGKPKKGETVFISGAAGGVGSIVAQIAKLKGCKVVGTAGSPKKIDFLENELDIDKGINYKTAKDLEASIKEACPNGIDVFFDNVGGAIFDAVFINLNQYARVAICGQMAEYNDSGSPQGFRPMRGLVEKSIRMEGFVVYDFTQEFDEGRKQLAQWYNDGKLAYRENLVEGFENIPTAFIDLFAGENIGKTMVKVGDGQ